MNECVYCVVLCAGLSVKTKQVELMMCEEGAAGLFKRLMTSGDFNSSQTHHLAAPRTESNVTENESGDCRSLANCGNVCIATLATLATPDIIQQNFYML